VWESGAAQAPLDAGSLEAQRRQELERLAELDAARRTAREDQLARERHAISIQVTIYTYTHTHTHMYIYIYTYTYTHTHTCMHKEKVEFDAARHVREDELARERHAISIQVPIYMYMYI